MRMCEVTYYMNKNYKAARSRYCLSAYAVMLTATASAALAVGAVVAAVLKLTLVEPSFTPAFISGIGAALLTLATTAILLFPTEKRVARALDRRLALSERVSTMLALDGDEGEMAQLQRTDTENALAKATRKIFLSKWLIATAVSLAVAVCLLISAILIPTKLPPPPPDDTVKDEAFLLTEWHITALRALIEEVKASDMAKAGIDATVSELESLIVRLGAVSTRPAMLGEVFDSMRKINGIADGLNSFSDAVKALISSPDKSTKEYGAALGSLSDPIVESKYMGLLASLTGEDAKENIKAFSTALSAAILTSSVSEGDALRGAIESFADGLEALDALEDGEIKAAAEELFSRHAEALSPIIAAQYANRQTADATCNTLMLIFGIAKDELPEDLLYSDELESGSTGGDYTEREDDVITDGGKGSGDVIYGSDDAIFDPESDSHVPYGDVLAIYDALKSGELDERELSDTLREFIKKYFDDLYYSDEENKN